MALLGVFQSLCCQPVVLFCMHVGLHRQGPGCEAGCDRTSTSTLQDECNAGQEDAARLATLMYLVCNGSAAQSGYWKVEVLCRQSRRRQGVPRRLSTTGWCWRQRRGSSSWQTASTSRS